MKQSWLGGSFHEECNTHNIYFECLHLPIWFSSIPHITSIIAHCHNAWWVSWQYCSRRRPVFQYRLIFVSIKLIYSQLFTLQITRSGTKYVKNVKIRYLLLNKIILFCKCFAYCRLKGKITKLRYYNSKVQWLFGMYANITRWLNVFTPCSILNGCSSKLRLSYGLGE